MIKESSKIFHFGKNLQMPISLVQISLDVLSQLSQNIVKATSLLSTAGLPISWTVGQVYNFCCRGPILILRPDSETSAQTIRVNVLDYFVKPKNDLV